MPATLAVTKTAARNRPQNTNTIITRRIGARQNIPTLQTVLISSDADGADHHVRYLSLYDNRFLRFYKGHTDKVVSIAMSPTDDHFMTGSQDRRVKLEHISSCHLNSASVSETGLKLVSSPTPVFFGSRRLISVQNV